MGFKDWAPWVGIAVSLIWNLINSRRSSLQWRAGHALAEFKTLKTPVDQSLNKLRASKKQVTALELSADGQPAIDERVKALNQQISAEFNELTVFLEALDTSHHSSRCDWVQSAEINFDSFVGTYDRLYAPKAPRERLRIVSESAAKLQTLIDAVHTGLEGELKSKMK
ncbi:hypothetical protein [Ciceribacter sp. L1K22]|uniref:hypothetical protein n=1 Tax=Ciceribacter sp. L1K22 TaxID=2820275 RepID=UPI001ABD9CAA|nr:hypothetical protein [Ciceribacter sp. L1K22]MBO3760402.1 hypothetical protein [Ciceribacter sp. L1K22]